MPKTCCAPGCKTGYRSENKRNVKNIALFCIPKEKSLRELWLRSIPRCWEANTNSDIFICEKHFNESDFQTKRKDSHSTRKKVNEGKVLQRRRLKKDAIPSKWPNVPDYLSKVPKPSRPTTSATTTAREVADLEREKVRDSFLSIDELKGKVDKSELPDGIIEVEYEEGIQLLAITCTNEPSVRYALRISKTLEFEMWSHGKSISPMQSENTEISSLPKQIGCMRQVETILHYLDGIPTPCLSHEENIEVIINQLKNFQFNNNQTVDFIIEQLSLLLKTPRQRRYSPSMLAMACLLERISPACYSQMYRDRWLILPTPDYLRRLSSGLNVDLEISDSTISYLKARFSRLASKDHVVSILMDEVYCRKMVEYSNGKFYGMENGDITGTVLCVMLKSVAGKYEDIISMSPICNIDADKLYNVWSNVTKVATEIGFDIVVTMTDGHSANVKLFNKKLLLGLNSSFTPNPWSANNIYPLFDTVHLFKNIYNNFVNKEHFSCPTFDETSIIHPNFAHIKELYHLELGKVPKMAYKLTDTVLSPKSIEKTNVLLADACFHESTINALLYFSNNGFPHFKDTADFCRIIRDWFNVVNVKNPEQGKRTRDHKRNPICADNKDETLHFLGNICKWLLKWRNEHGPSQGLSKQTFDAMLLTNKALPDLVTYLLDKKNLDYILLGNIQSDYLEKRFGWYRQVGGANYFISVLQLLQAEKGIRLRSLVSMDFDMTAIKEIFSGDKCNKEKALEYDVSLLLEEVITFDLEDSICADNRDEAILYYVAGYIARCLMKKTECHDCQEVISPGKVAITPIFDQEPRDDQDIDAKEKFVASFTRGGLVKPGDAIYIAVVHAFALFQHIIQNAQIKQVLLQSSNPRATFVEVFIAKVAKNENTSPLLSTKCKNSHIRENDISNVAMTVFNIGSKNFTSELNDKIHKSRKRQPKANPKTSVSARKQMKLTSS